MFHKAHVYTQKKWKFIIDGVEIWKPYVQSWFREIYNHIFIGDIRAIITKLPPYDLIFLGEVLEHMPLTDGYNLIQDAVERATRKVLITTPSYHAKQGAVLGNKHERHVSFWKKEDFEVIAKNLQVTMEIEELKGHWIVQLSGRAK